MFTHVSMEYSNVSMTFIFILHSIDFYTIKFEDSIIDHLLKPMN